jgi:hypothetical protein
MNGGMQFTFCFCCILSSCRCLRLRVVASRVASPSFISQNLFKKLPRFEQVRSAQWVECKRNNEMLEEQ